MINSQPKSYISQFLKYDTYNLIEGTVDNSHNEDIPPLDSDFTFYGGTYRNVEFITVPKQHISLDDFASEGFYINHPEVKSQRIFDVSVNNALVEKQFNMAKAYPEKYGITLLTTITIENNKGLKIALTPIEG